jgi:hypothetical protein
MIQVIVMVQQVMFLLRSYKDILKSRTAIQPPDESAGFLAIKIDKKITLMPEMIQRIVYSPVSPLSLAITQDLLVYQWHYILL